MKIAWGEIKGAAQRSFVALWSFPLVLLAPLFCSSASYRLLTFGFHQEFGRKHVLAELFLLLALCFPLGTVAEAVVARMLLVFREGRRPSSAQVGEIVRAPGLVRLLARLIWVVILWTVLALVISALPWLLAIVVKAFAFAMAHHGARMPHSHGGAFAYVMTFAVFEGVLVSRYSFVLPLFAAEGRGSRELFRAAVERAKPNLLPLSVVNVLEYGLVFGIAHAMRPFETGLSLRGFVVVALSLLFTSAITTWFELIKADLAFVSLSPID